MKRSIKALLVTCIAAFASTTSWGAFVTWELNPAGLDGAVGSPTRSYTVMGSSITATGYDNVAGPDTLHQLFYKNEPMVGGATERGLGLVNTNSNELNLKPDGTPEHYIQLDLRSILAQGFIGGEISVASVQNGEGFRLFGSNTQGDLGTQLPGLFMGLAFDNQFVAVPNFGSFQFVSVAAAAGRVLPVAFRATPIPEVSQFLPILGLIAAVGSTHYLRRRRAVC